MTDYENMTAGEMLDRTSIALVHCDGEPMLYTPFIRDPKNPDAVWIRKHKQELIDEILRRERDNYDEMRAEFIKRIDGLSEIRRMKDTYADEEYETRKAINGDGIMAPPKRTVTAEDIRKALEEHPLAALWLKVEAQRTYANYELAAIGDEVERNLVEGASIDEAKALWDKREEEFHQRHQGD